MVWLWSIAHALACRQILPVPDGAICATEEALVALDATGAERWRQRVRRASLVHADEEQVVVHVGTFDPAKQQRSYHLTSHDLSTGTRRWTVTTGTETFRPSKTTPLPGALLTWEYVDDRWAMVVVDLADGTVRRDPEPCRTTRCEPIDATSVLVAAADRSTVLASLENGTADPTTTRPLPEGLELLEGGLDRPTHAWSWGKRRLFLRSDLWWLDDDGWTFVDLPGDGMVRVAATTTEALVLLQGEDVFVVDPTGHVRWTAPAIGLGPRFASTSAGLAQLRGPTLWVHDPITGQVVWRWTASDLRGVFGGSDGALMVADPTPRRLDPGTFAPDLAASRLGAGRRNVLAGAITESAFGLDAPSALPIEAVAGCSDGSFYTTGGFRDARHLTHVSGGTATTLRAATLHAYQGDMHCLADGGLLMEARQPVEAGKAFLRWDGRDASAHILLFPWTWKPGSPNVSDQHWSTYVTDRGFAIWSPHTQWQVLFSHDEQVIGEAALHRDHVPNGGVVAAKEWVVAPGHAGDMRATVTWRGPAGEPTRVLLPDDMQTVRSAFRAPGWDGVVVAGRGWFGLVGADGEGARHELPDAELLGVVHRDGALYLLVQEGRYGSPDRVTRWRSVAP